MTIKHAIWSVEITWHFFRGWMNYQQILLEKWIDADSVFRLIHRNLWSTECMWEYFRIKDTWKVLSTEEWNELTEKPPWSFIYPPSLDECIWDSRTSELILAKKRDTDVIIGSLLNYTTDIRTAYEREFKAHYLGNEEPFDRALKRVYGGNYPEYNIFSSIWISTDMNPRTRLILMMGMVYVWANQLIKHSQEDKPWIAEMNRWINDKENAFFRACKKNFDIQELTLTWANGDIILARNPRDSYNSVMTTFWKDSVIKMSSI